MASPEFFEVAALLDRLDDWFSRRVIDVKREELYERIRVLSRLQYTEQGLEELDLRTDIYLGLSISSDCCTDGRKIGGKHTTNCSLRS